MSRVALALLVAALLSACGTYRIAYRFPSKETQVKPLSIKKDHAHGIGLGFGGFFFMMHQMFPALVDYTGDQSVGAICPDGVYEVSHEHLFWHNAVAAYISYVVGINAYHLSVVEWRCVAAAPSPPAPAAGAARAP